MKTITITLYKKEELIEEQEFTDSPGAQAIMIVTSLMRIFARALKEDCDLLTVKIINDKVK